MSRQLELFPGAGRSPGRTLAARAARKPANTHRLPTRASTEEAALENADLPVNTTPGLPPYETVALVLQGGGALGAYQAGVFQGLHEAGIELSCLSGISIGALNTAIIAGNPPGMRVPRLLEFWETICQPNGGPGIPPFLDQSFFNMNDTMRQAMGALHAGSALMNGQQGFFQPRLPPPSSIMPGSPDTASYYDTSALKATLERLCDFDLINSARQQVSVGAVNVRNGNFVYFDNTRMALRAEHFMASGALPPAFAAVEIDGEHYWDGGLVSNTPLTQVLESRPLRDTLVFQVDLWSARGQVPVNMSEVSDRMKDIRYSSRTRLITEQLRWTQYLRHILQHLLEDIPADIRASDPYCRMAQDLACSKRYNVIHLIYRNRPYERHYKDFQFGLATMREHWACGLEDIRRTLAEPERLAMPENASGFVTHDIHREEIEQLMEKAAGKASGAS
ncbi:patatin-like phospholipase family protein [Pollutimonas sp. M17]|uniref:patatin-like phospholipase family protein n=1 Tax=Pollutimonas sp. M17 TaxID=2962065 RepID=UPI0021F47D74|nr:patatin-like phospholipase family protein [Pollutimonas sp. M17]UYO94907.1 patatin-like phospholipase family protein [Pollutimonas sp. M17]HWK71977.1 patatin-like phospholipase family protein [Burkholderiaceae bacterium]